jgi:hypothetical protein
LGEAYRVAKSCPGRLVDMGRVRGLVRQGLLDGAGS